ncbi:unnamed protein product [Enterobius vermicularis]|uniref:Uncharacterized protein n=1 Tax=Enterobius vermicularis TaxID=51028 RepID=A0A0N4UXV0_ENTVE|nr:unnamed protein product [Enterobius vermicularis]
MVTAKTNRRSVDDDDEDDDISDDGDGDGADGDTSALSAPNHLWTKVDMKNCTNTYAGIERTAHTVRHSHLRRSNSYR